MKIFMYITIILTFISVWYDGSQNTSFRREQEQANARTEEALQYIIKAQQHTDSLMVAIEGLD